MALQHSNTADAFTPEDYGALVDVAIKSKSILAQTATFHPTTSKVVNFPKLVANPGVNHYAELATISPTDATTGEVVVNVHKTAGISRLSREIAEDSTPDIAQIVGDGLADQIAYSMDAAYLGDTTPNGPEGLQSIDFTDVDVAGGTLTNLDPFITARYAALSNRAKLSHWLVRPEVAETLSKIKVQSGSTQTLLQFVDDGLQIAGLPVIVSDQVDEDTSFWGVDFRQIAFVLRKGTEVLRSIDSGFYNDAVDIRAVARYGIGFLNEPGVVRGHDVTP